MVLVPIHRVARRLLGLIAIILALVAILILLGQMRNVYQQHQKFRRFESYSQYVGDISNDLVKLEAIANQSNLSMDRIYIMLGQRTVRSKQEPINPNQDRSNTSVIAH